MSQQEPPRFNLRLTPDLQKRIKHAAIESERSVNAEILARLETTFSPDPTAQLAAVLRPFASLGDHDRAKIVELLAQTVDILAKGTAKR
ncbi:Arc family DNA-binding protein [Pseudaminobacter arsenicus]|uniref:Arc family DNA-binding protein n=1 Tax=Borborobacter arsenicus TaxID=1851146 RepID=A0A432V6V8_9HYPH|nr:Arc family DNA-binding protein [Pseudaminobacter arsenicus]RUM97887.1 Arc family DNA-binding protein [Pseudaminobacter arsenicus]